MDLSGLTVDQRTCVEHVGGPLLVSAGAGSGKTFMLTQRIAYALLDPDISGVDDIDQVLAITFTELAASEIKSRVRNKLREEGMAEQALKVDASWIGTIHGMCSRILHEHALELGLDPSFGLLDETDAARLLDSAVSAALAEATEAAADGDPAYQELFDLYESAGATSVVGDMVRSILEAAANVRGGMDALVTRDAEPPQQIAADMCRAIEDCEAVAREGIGTNGKQDTFTSHALDVLCDPEHGLAAFEKLAAQRTTTYDDVAQALCALDVGFGSHTSKEPYATGYARFRKAVADLSAECSLGLAQTARDELIALARRSDEFYRAAKAAEGALDQNDLLILTLEAFEQHPDVEAAYRDRFRLVMVDEFQDTSGIQIALIDHLTDGDRRLCTVGDTQQSIYRFRGADIETYRAHKHHMRELEDIGGLACELDKNFRSHGDIIAFVNRIFGQEEVFGSDGEFIELTWDEDHPLTNEFCDRERIDITVLTGDHGTRGHRAATTLQRHYIEAETIARRFEDLHEEAPNRRWGDMVILLGRMTNAAVYADTLRAHGIPCIVTGGSGFDKTPEAEEIATLLYVLADPWDNAVMHSALTGAAFGLDGDELVRLGMDREGRQRAFWDGLVHDGADDPSPRVRLASEVLIWAVRQARRSRAHDLLTEIALCSGWLERLQQEGVQGMAQAANVLKAIRLVASIEDDPTHLRGIAETAARLSDKLARGMKEKPGTLASEHQDAVRIMTIHASKGLEFPVVALADFYGMITRTPSLHLETVGDTVYFTLDAPSSLVGKNNSNAPYRNLSKAKLTEPMMRRLEEAGDETGFDGTPEEATSAHEFAEAIAARGEAEELGEMRRRFYVGATRPREALIIAINTTVAGKSAAEPYNDVVLDLARGLYGESAEYTTAPDGIDFGGIRRARVERQHVGYTDDGVLRLGPTSELTDTDDEARDYLCPELQEMLCIDVIDEEDDAAGDASGSPADTTELPVIAAASADASGTTSELPRLVDVPCVPNAGEHPSELVGEPQVCDPLHAGTFSYTRIAPEGAADEQEILTAEAHELGDVLILGDAEQTPLALPPSQRPDDVSAVAFGSALHQTDQWSVEELMAERARTADASPDATCDLAASSLPIPDDGRLAAIAHTWGLTDDIVPLLDETFTRWRTSDVATEALRHPTLQAEAPLFVKLSGPQGEPLHLEGAIDLLCWDAKVPKSDQTALVIDFKTGGSAAETAEHLQEKHLLQASCYAYAVLLQGFAAVDARFVRVQQVQELRPEQPQVVMYRFDRADLQALEETIRDAYARAQ